MGPLFGAWRPVEPKLLRRGHQRLSHTGGCGPVRYDSSRRDPSQVVAGVDPAAFLERAYSARTARLHVEFDCSGTRTRYWIQWWEPDAGRGIGWHADETEPDYGPVHLQLDHPDGTTERRDAEHVEDEHPYRTFERHLTAIPEVLVRVGWK